LAVRTSWLTAIRWGALGVGIAWVAVILSAAFMGQPGSVNRSGRIWAVLLTAVLCAAVGIPAMRISQYAETTAGVIDEVFKDYTPGPGAAGAAATQEAAFSDGRVNIMLVGSDSGADRVGVRADTVIVASINARTGRTILFSLPRNMQRIPFPAGSVMAEQFPRGFVCPGDACLLNAIYEWATEKAASDPTLFAGDNQPGMTALRGGVATALGLDIDYYGLVNLEGFERIIDALGGVTIRVDTRLPIGGIDSKGRSVKPSGYIEPGLQRLNGFQALWYARSRAGSDDYTRVARQRCLIGAVVREADPANVLINYQRVLNSAPGAVDTDIPRDALPALVKVGFRVKSQPVESLAFVPPLVPNTARPDFARMRTLVQEAIARSDAGPPEPAPADTAPVQAAPTDPSSAAPPGTGAPTPTGPPVEDPVALQDVCGYA
jgi:LCP family protein required for cell wall assembly